MCSILISFKVKKLYLENTYFKFLSQYENTYTHIYKPEISRKTKLHLHFEINSYEYGRYLYTA